LSQVSTVRTKLPVGHAKLCRQQWRRSENSGRG